MGEIMKNSKEELAIECVGLTKKFGDFTAVDSIDLRVKKGELFGFLGPNGAGKTTTIKMLTALLSPTEGFAKVACFDLKAESAAVRSRIGIVPQEFALFNELTPIENLWYIGELYNMDEREIAAKTEELLKKVNLYDKKDVVCEGFSGGMKQRLSIAASLLHTPQILLMDEPTSGLDPQSRISLRELTKELNSTGITIVYTTHDMEEADKLCQRIAIMDKGKIIALGTPEELKEQNSKGHEIEIELEKINPKIMEEIKEFLNASFSSSHNGVMIFHVRDISGGVINKISNFLEKKKAVVRELKVREPSLEDVFINLTRKDLRE